MGIETLNSPPWWERRADLLDAISDEVDTRHPLLRIHWGDVGPVVKGRYQLIIDGKADDVYDIRIAFPVDYDAFPVPTLWEVAEKIPRSLDRHINRDGTACPCVPEEWLATTDDTSFRQYMAGPVHDFFLAQSYFGQHNRFPWTDRRHGLQGAMDAYGELLNVEASRETLLPYLDTLSHVVVKGHRTCPCGSAQRLRDCCRPKIDLLRARVSPTLAVRMKDRILTYGRS